MFIPSWLRSSKTRPSYRQVETSRTPASRAVFRPQLETLEDRTLLSFGFGAAFSIGGPGLDYGNSIAKDASGDTYLSGRFSGQGVNFNPNGQPVYLNGGQYEGYVAMYRPDSTLAWVTDIGSSVGTQLAVQGSSVYAACVAWTGSTATPYNILALKLNATDGTIAWTNTLASGVTSTSNGGGQFRAVAVGPSGNVYFAAMNASAQAFVAKVDPLGNILWTQTTTGGVGDGTGIAVDSSENVFVTGGYTGTVSFGTGRTLTSMSGTQDAFVWKLNASGVSVWAGSVGSSGDDTGYAITVDGAGNAILTGEWGYSSTISAKTISRNNDFDPGTGVLALANNGGYDVFLVKLAPNTDGSMKLSWARDIGGPSTVTGPGDWAKGITVDSTGNVYTTGSFSDSVDFDPGTGRYVLTSAGGRDIFVSKLDANGNFVAAADLGGTAYDDGASIAVDSSGSVWTTGGFRGTADFDPTAGTYNLTQNGYPAAQIFDIFVSKLTQSGSLLAVTKVPPAGQVPALTLAPALLLPGSIAPIPPPPQGTQATLHAVANAAVLAGGAPHMSIGAGARDLLVSTLSHGAAKAKAGDLAALLFAEGIDFQMP